MLKKLGLHWGLRAASVAALSIIAACSAGGDSETLATVQGALTQGVPYRVRALDYTAFQDSDTLHDGNCGSGPVDAETTSDPNGGTCNVGWTKAGEWLEYSIQVASAGKFNIVSRVASATTGRTFHLSIDGATVGGSQTVPSAGWQAFADRTLTDVSLTAGSHTLRVTFETGDANLNHIDIAPGTVTLPKRLEAENYVRAFESTPASNFGNACNRGDGVDKETTGDYAGGCNVGWTTPGEWLEYSIQVANAGKFDIVSRVASASTGKTFRLSIDGLPLGGSQSVPNAGWQAFADRTLTDVNLAAGSHTLRVSFETGDTNLNYIDVTPGTVTLPARIEAEDYQRANESTPASNSGGACDRGDGVDKEITGDATGGCNVGWTTAGEWLEYDVNVPQAGLFDFNARVGSAVTGRTVQINVDGTSIGSVSSPSAGWATFEDRKIQNVSLSAGPHGVRALFVQGDTNLNYLDITAHSAVASAPGYSFGAATNYNAFVFQDLSVTPSIAGPVAAGRDISAQSFGYNTSAVGSIGVVVGHNFTGSNGSVQRDLVYGNTLSLSNVGVLQGTSRKATPIDYVAEKATLDLLTANLAQFVPNGTTVSSQGGTTIAFTGVDPSRNVFSVDGAILGATDVLRFYVPSTSTVIVNVTGTAAVFETTGMQLGGLTPGHLVWNFPQASTIRLAQTGFKGTLLATNAAVTQSSSTLDGVLIASSLTGGDNGLTWLPFNGSLTVCSNATLSMVPGSPQLAGTTIALGGTATCADNRAPEFHYDYFNTNTDASWHEVAPGFSTSTVNWNTTALPAGPYQARVVVRRVGEASISGASAVNTFVFDSPVGIRTDTTVVEDFDSLGTAAVGVPASGWRIDKQANPRTVGTYAAATYKTEFSAGALLPANSSNGIYNFGAGVANSQAANYWLNSTDRAPGWLAAGSAMGSGGTKSGNLYLALRAPVDKDLSGLDIGYDIEKYSAGTNLSGFRVQLYSSTDGANWASAGNNFLHAFAPDTTNTGFDPAPGAVLTVPSAKLAASIPRNTPFYLAWNYTLNSSSSSDASNAQAVGLDNVSVKGEAVCAPSCAGKTCGPDGCGGLCGAACSPPCSSRSDCKSDEFCSDTGVCKPDSTACDPAAKSDCRATCPCNTGSQCVNDQDCQGELICALGMGPAFGRTRGTNACVKPFCIMSRSQGCGYSGAPCGSCDDAVPCTRNGDCPGSEVCVNGAGSSVNAGTPNVCLPPLCQAAQPECGDPSSKCGKCACTPNCATKKCGDDSSDGCGGRCTDFCHERQPGCQTDADCPDGDACVLGGGLRVAQSESVNVCLPKICLNPDPKVASCGSLADVCGVCPEVPDSACANRACGVEPSSGTQCGPTGVPCIQGNAVRAFSRVDVDLLSSGRGGARPVTVPAIPVIEPVDDSNQEPGALAGTFEVDPRGNGTYTIPIVVPPGRAGMRPKISLNYNSRGGNGIAGVGWSVGGISTIARCPKTVATDGVAVPVQYDATDALCLDGARLLLISGDAFHAGAEYRTEIDTFQKIVVLGSADESGIFFRAFQKNGEIHEYGGSAQEKLYREATPGTRVPRAWGLSRIQDRAGNMVTLKYGKLENTESRMSSGVSQDTLEFFPDEIAYGGVENQFGRSDSRMEVKFEYSDDRADYMEGFTSSGARITRTKRLKAIRTLLADQPIRSYELAYKYAPTGLGESFDQDSTGPSRLDTIQECSSKNGVRACTPATVLSYADERGFAPNTALGTAPNLRGPLFTMDANGDGFADFVAVGDGTSAATLLIGNGSRASVGFTPFTITPAAGEFPCFSQASVVDTDGDGRDDLVDLCPHMRSSPSRPEGEHNYRIYKFDGNGRPSSIVTVTLEGVRSITKPRAFIVDADGDGVADLFECVDPEGESTRGEVRFFPGHRGDGPAFDMNPSGVISSSDKMVGNCAVFNVPKPNHRPLPVGPSLITVQDITGDGVPDLLIHETTPVEDGESLIGTSIWSRYVFGSEGAHWETVRVDSTSPDVWNDSSRFKFVDVNGDGLKDLITLESTPQLAINTGGHTLSEGSPFAPNTDPKLVERFTKYSLMNSVGLDYDGDGAEDLLRLLEPASGEPAGHWLWDRANTDSARYGTFKLDHAPLSLSDPSSFFLNVQPNREPPTDSGGRHPGFSLADVDGDGSVDLVQLQNGGGVAVTFGHFGHENLLASIVDGLGKRIEVKYEAESRFSDRSAAPTYRFAAPEQFPNPFDAKGRCVTDGNTACIKHVGPVVSSFRVLQSAKGSLSNRPDVGYHFRYEDARLGLLGRGWLGFGKTTIEKVGGTFPETPIDVTEVKRDNQTFVASSRLFPFAGREISRVTTTQLAQSPIESHPAKRRETTSQQWEVGTSASNRPFPFVRSHVQQTDEVLDTGEVLPIVTVTTHVMRINGYGDVGQSETTTQSGGANLSTQTLIVDFELRPESWLIALPKHRSVTESVFGTASAKPREEHVVSWTYDADGLLETITREPEEADDSGLKLVTTLERYEDKNRNIRTVTTTGGWRDRGRVTRGTRSISFQYDADGISPRRVIRHQGDDCAVDPSLDDATDSGFGSTCLIHDLKFDPRDGTLVGRIDPAGVGTQMSYDAFGRVLSQVTPDHETRYSYAEGTPFVFGKHVVGTRLQVTTTDVTTGGTSTKNIDALGRVVQVGSSGLDGDNVFQEFNYDWGSVLEGVTRAHLDGDTTQGEIGYNYDARWRLKELDYPDKTSIAYLHAASANASSGATTEGQELWIAGVVDQRGHTSLQHRDFRGNSLRSVDEQGNVTRYVYDALGTLGTVTDAQGNVTTISTDKLGRITSHQDADTGEQDRQYTAFGDLFVFTDGVGTDAPRKRVYEYDDVGRLLTLTAPEGLTSFSYDRGVNAAGRLVETSSPDGHAEHYDYEEPTANGDPMANRAFLKTITRQIGGASFVTGLNYNDKNELSQVDQPASSNGNHFAVRYEYDDVGHLKRVRGTSSDGTHDDALFWQRDANFEGQAIASETFGNGVTTSYTYEDTTGRLKDLTTRDPTASILQELKYLTYDDNGNIKTRSSSFRDVGVDTLEVFDESYDYDELDRLTTIKEGKKASSVGYDAIGNITSKAGVGTYNYTEDGKVSRPHAVDNISVSGNKVVDLKYDDFGNVIHRDGDGVTGGSQEVNYSSFNLPTLVTLGTGSQVHYQYDASQNRVLVDVGDCAEQANTTCNRRVYVGGAYERQSATDENGAFIRDLYKVFVDGRQVAQVEREARPGTSTETRRYLHADHLGSSQLLTDETGKVASLRRFNAFGEALGASSTDAASSSVRAGFTGHETDVETGLVNMRGRIYDPRLGRFLQADPPLSESPFWSQGLNRYSYAFNNPLRYTDPSGFAGAPEPPPDEPPPDEPPPDDGSDTSNQSGADCYGEGCADAAKQEMMDRFARYDAELNAQEAANQGASTDPAQGDSEAMHEDTSSASNGTPGTPGRGISDEARRDTYFALGAGQGAVPFGTLGSDLSPPRTARDRFDLGTGQLAGAATALGESGGLVAVGGAEALTGIGIPLGIATELAAVVVAVGAATNAIEGIYNIATGDSGGGKGGGASTPTGAKGQNMNVPSPQGQRAANSPTTIGGREFSGHALDRMQGQGIPPSAVENAIQAGSGPGKVAGTIAHYDSVNDITVITDAASGRVVTVDYGLIRQ